MPITPPLHKIGDSIVVNEQQAKIEKSYYRNGQWFYVVSYGDNAFNLYIVAESAITKF